MITNKPSLYPDDYRTKQLRAAEENRAKWFLYLYKEGVERGLDAGFAREAMAESGRFLAEDRYADAEGLAGFVARFMDETREKAYESRAETAGNAARIECGYCPMVAAWARLVPEEELPVLCGLCEEMTRALCRARGLGFRVEASIAAGDAACVFEIGEAP